MSHIVIEVPKYLIFQNSINFISDLQLIENHLVFEFNFSSFKYIDPFSLLFVSSEIHLFRSRFKNSKFIATNYEHCTYAAHMGFFQAFGVNFGNEPGEARGSSTYIPIHIYNTEIIITEAKEQLINPAELLEGEAKRISNILTRSDSGNLNQVLTYCIREIFRNVIEHSQSPQFGFCAQYRPSLNIVSFSILDRGIGLQRSLKQNPTLNINSDEEAILAAIQPAISSKVYKGQKRKPKGEWANSGYGLFMTSNICRRGGGFFIASGDTGYYTSENKERTLATPFIGTALNLAMDTRRIKDLYTMLREIDSLLDKPKNKPSKSTMGLIIDRK